MSEPRSEQKKRLFTSLTALTEAALKQHGLIDAGNLHEAGS
jgi:hypothetical protein